MIVHEQKPDKIQEASVAYSCPASGGNRYFLSVAKILEGDTTLRPSLMPGFQRSIFDGTKNLTSRGGYKIAGDESWVMSGDTGIRVHHKVPKSQLIQTARFDKTVLFAGNIASAKSIDLEQLWLRRLICRLRKAGEREAAGRIEYLTGEENAVDGGNIPATVSIASFVKFYLDNTDLGKPLLGVTPDGDIQAVWTFSDKRRFVAEFLDNDVVKYVYRRSGNMRSSKLFTLGQQPLHKIRGLLKNTSI